MNSTNQNSTNRAGGKNLELLKALQMKSGSYGNVTCFTNCLSFCKCCIFRTRKKKKKKQYHLGKDVFDHLQCVIINGSWMLMLDLRLGDHLQSNTVREENNACALRQSKTTGSKERYLNRSKY